MRKRCLELVHRMARADRDIVFIGSDLGVGVLDAMKLFAEFNGDWDHEHGHFRACKLTEATAALGLTVDDAHTAAGDCRMTLALLEGMAQGL